MSNTARKTTSDANRAKVLGEYIKTVQSIIERLKGAK
jgi:hypothetical protein